MRLPLPLALALAIPLPGACQRTTLPVSFSSEHTALRTQTHFGAYTLLTGTDAGNAGVLYIYGPKKTSWRIEPSTNSPDSQTLEWRLADGAPIAVILPVKRWTKQYRRREPEVVRTGNLLLIRGLGYGIIGKRASYLDTVIDASLPDAYAVARRLADASFAVPAYKGKK